ncbi:arf-gap with sh3 ank repeat hypothetical protein [Limosa lapponica baueri]|uniref:PH domain-containing protein n=1 Tax=Limosa lapponica baueri TaxID=1758121 RepID=A0A2I0T319_LIMLA|nr:arf-gap with sh3 ank repeat hypothetical protein [Limosa lapponica baueri]
MASPLSRTFCALIRKVWQKRKCGVKYGCLTISHSTINRPPVKLNLLTCQVRPHAEEKKCFDLVTHNRTYHFQAEDEQECVVGTLDRVTQEGNTALHYGALYNQPNCLKLLLKGKATFSTVNAAGETALDVARRLKHTECEELVGGMEG